MFTWLKNRLQRNGLTAYVTHADCLQHNMGAGHPECPERLTAIRDQLMASQIYDSLQEVEAPEATYEQLARVHPPRYVEYLEACAPSVGTFRMDPDTAMSPGTLQAARRAAGAVVKAVELVAEDKAANAFCAVRPPGHHAESDKAMGFCFFNNIAVGVTHALTHYKFERVAVVDFDVHHGNGTEEILHDDPRVLMVSIFQHPFYPYCGDEPRGPNMHNVPLKAGSGGREFREAVENVWLPLLHDFQPQMLFISAGFDAHREDDMGSLGLVESDYEWVTRHLMQIADQYCAGRVVSVLEGGYDLSALGRSVAAHIRALSDG
ncbi:histone deacetylase family protein [Chromobacterium subtsugae]|uniref:Histone deacetylase family protein n=1 Tax=Chromobacterium subtsugae TaxID=251747 RepID=A0ABS7FDG2_9NEIS|nr:MULTISPECIES: histone deacetylase family protein [Chromobacterium]KUM04960.1 deacetylase [Chromobacterium subtsugae]KZE86924.1 deacetylase [Chromobacterium sp. F49]MBW7566815.1 histone deacetylase family protein [Chromobacterium subtsugae]MBW8288120.1 histone deacetylase family protein [Chromobacterium subtsugae]WSE92799.1 histone deacetylase family protein [Chromobacterium subtsugae]